MARGRTVVEVAPGEAIFIVEAMMLDGRIDAKTLREYQARYLQEISSLEARIARLRELASPALPAVIGAAVVAAAPAVGRAARRAGPRAVRAVKTAAKRAKGKVSPERIRSRMLQGKYLGLMRQIPKTVVKQKFGREAIEKNGKEAVIAEMEKYIAGKKK